MCVTELLRSECIASKPFFNKKNGPSRPNFLLVRDTGMSRWWTVCKQITRGPSCSLMMTITGLPLFGIENSRTLFIKLHKVHFKSVSLKPWMKWHLFRKEIYGCADIFFSFLYGTSLKTASDKFPLHSFVIIWDGKFIQGHKHPRGKKQEPHHA